jgi:hypothetical protein
MYSKIAKTIVASIIQKTNSVDDAPILEELEAAGIDSQLLEEVINLLDRCNLIYESGVPSYATDIVKNNISTLKRKILLYGADNQRLEEELRLLNQPSKIYLGVNYNKNNENIYVKSDTGEILTIKKINSLEDLNSHIVSNKDVVVYFNDELVFIDKNTSGYNNLQ